jgi:hypothetical protein
LQIQGQPVHSKTLSQQTKECIPKVLARMKGERGKGIQIGKEEG